MRFWRTVIFFTFRRCLVSWSKPIFTILIASFFPFTLNAQECETGGCNSRLLVKVKDDAFDSIPDITKKISNYDDVLSTLDFEEMLSRLRNYYGENTCRTRFRSLRTRMVGLYFDNSWR